MASKQYSDALQYLKDRYSQSTGVEASREYLNITNEALERFFNRAWDFAKKTVTKSFAAPYSTGTVSINAAATAVTGVGTTFTVTMVGRFIYLNGELRGYLITAFSSVTGITIESYRGDTNLAGVTFEILEERVILPTDFREFEKPTAGSVMYDLLPMPGIQDLIIERRRLHLVAEPQFYLVEFVRDTNDVPQPYLWLYPPPSTTKILDFAYYPCPPTVTTGTDYLKIPDAGSYWSVLQKYLLAGVLEKKGQAAEFLQALSLADADANKLCAATRTTSEVSPGRQPYMGGSGDRRTRFHAQIAPGILNS